MAELRLAHTVKYFGFGDSDDYVVLDGARVIGRIFLRTASASRAPLVLDHHGD